MDTQATNVADFLTQLSEQLEHAKTANEELNARYREQAILLQSATSRLLAMSISFENTSPPTVYDASVGESCQDIDCISGDGCHTCHQSYTDRYVDAATQTDGGEPWWYRYGDAPPPADELFALVPTVSGAPIIAGALLTTHQISELPRAVRAHIGFTKPTWLPCIHLDVAALGGGLFAAHDILIGIFGQATRLNGEHVKLVSKRLKLSTPLTSLLDCEEESQEEGTVHWNPSQTIPLTVSDSIQTMFTNLFGHSSNCLPVLFVVAKLVHAIGSSDALEHKVLCGLKTDAMRVLPVAIPVKEVSIMNRAQNDGFQSVHNWMLSAYKYGLSYVKECLDPIVSEFHVFSVPDTPYWTEGFGVFVIRYVTMAPKY